MRWQDSIPYAWRLRYQLLKRKRADLQAGIPFAEKRQKTEYPFRIELQQAVKRSYLYENKLHNIRLASESIRQTLIRPGELFSFWRSVGKPGAREGFKAGRNLVNGRLQAGIGGGLCQLSGLIYHLALLGGLEVVERHSHSVDIYQESERFTPLGADATVAYGYKDLRFRNNLPFNIYFEVKVAAEQITGRLCAEKEISPEPVRFIRKPKGAGEEVKTWREMQTCCQLLTSSFYQKNHK
ncbi:MAG: VanW family protein [Bacteroidetes bacterium]|nr:VanW family protein [Bacteroidota bacterium]